MRYVVAVPSYQRADVLVKNTLPMLRGLKPNMHTVCTVFAANKTEAALYRRAMDAAGFPRVPVVTGVRGLSRQRRFIHEHYRAGTRIVNVDDDVTQLLEKHGNRLRPLRVSLDVLAERAFALCDRHGARMWGICGCANGMFLKDTVTVGLRYLVGCFTGSHAGDPVFTDAGTPSSGEDYARSIASYKRYGAVVRLNWVAPKTAYFADGGMQSELGGKEQRARDHTERLEAIARRHPDCATAYTKAGGVTNLRLAVLTTEKITKLSFMRQPTTGSARTPPRGRKSRGRKSRGRKSRAKAHITT